MLHHAEKVPTKSQGPLPAVPRLTEMENGNKTKTKQKQNDNKEKTRSKNTEPTFGRYELELDENRTVKNSKKRETTRKKLW